MSLIQPKQAAEKLTAAFKSGDEQQMSEAWQVFSDELAEEIRGDFEAYQESKDDAALAQRGYRTLTAIEKVWYTKVAEALKTSRTKQSFIDILHSSDVDDIMPETIIDDVLRYLQETRPLLSKIRFQNAGYSTKWIINDNTVQRGGWGEIDAKITKEIKGALEILHISQNRYTAFSVIPLDILDMGPTFIDAFIRATLAEALGLGLEDAVVNGTGVNMPCGVTREPNSAKDPSTGYTKKTPVAVKSFSPAEYGALVAKVAKTEKGKMRTFDHVTLLVNMVDYLTKIMPATTMLSTTGAGYVGNLFPYPTEVIPCNSVEEGKASLGILDDYTLAVGGSRNGAIEYDDSIGFLDDTRTFKLIQHADGRPYDNTSFIYLDISKLDPAYVTVKNVSSVAGQTLPVADAPVVDSTDEAKAENIPTA